MFNKLLSYTEAAFTHYDVYQSANRHRKSRGFGRQKSNLISACHAVVPTRELPVVPILGPIIMAPPLNIGAEMRIDSPTPLQWNILVEAVTTHSNHYSKNNADENIEEVFQETATVDSVFSPIIAVIDETTRSLPVQPIQTSFLEGGRYATLAAVVGISRTSKNDKDYSRDLEENFFVYMSLLKKNADTILPITSSVRLVGVGRVALRDLFYRVPTKLNGSNYEKIGDVKEIDDLQYDEYNDKIPTVMARFEPLIDDSSVYSNVDEKKFGGKHSKSERCSPAHAIASLSKAAFKVQRMHEIRQRMVSALSAAYFRLKIVRKQKMTNSDSDEFDDDYDGIGLLYNNALVDDETSESDEIPMKIDDFLEIFQGVNSNESQQNQEFEPNDLTALENYGLGNYGALSSIPSLTNVAMKLLAPYYSKEFRQREEYEYEIASFVAFRTLEGIIDPSDVAWCLQCTNSMERLERSYDIMLDHRIRLEKLAEVVISDLLDCGEECTDLW